MAELTERQRRILARLVAEYIEQGEPVSSAWLAAHSALGLSSATVRNILARLEEQGLVRQPHTSAGRMPTDSGYRLYVDLLLTGRKRVKPCPRSRRGCADQARSSDLLEHRVARSLTRVASDRLRDGQYRTGDATPARRFREPRRQPRLVIVVATGGAITHKVVETDERPDAATLSQAANYINAEFVGLTMHEARAAILEHLRQERVLYDVLMARALELARTGLADIQDGDTLHLQGASFLIDELAGEAEDRQRTFETLRALFRMIEEKHQLVQLLTRSIDATGLTVVIGSEHSVSDLHPFSLVASSFQDGDRTGTVGCDWADPDALPARHLRRRQRVADDGAAARRAMIRTMSENDVYEGGAGPPTPSWRSSASATTSRIGCSAPPRSSTTTGSDRARKARVVRRDDG
jgi:heat-inducible transcriptional repressor